VDLRLEGAGTIDSFGDEGGEASSARAAVAEDSPAPTLTYEPYYGLDEKPFSLSPDPRFLYRSASHAPVLRDLAAAIRRREGLVVLTGDIGTGKTTLCRAVIEQLDQKTFATFVPDPFVTREDLLKTMLIDFGVMSVDDLVKGRLKGASRPDLSFPLYEFLRSLEPLDAFAVLVIDEVQNLSLPLLEEIRILSDLEAGRKLLQVVLVGQPEFDELLRLPRMRPIHQRVSVHCQLQPLDRESVTAYVSHRLRMAGATAERVRVLPEALDLVHAASGGVPRLINLLCDKALAHGEPRQTTRIGADLVRRAMADLRMTDPSGASVAAPSPRVVPMESPVAATDGGHALDAPPARVQVSSTNSLARGKVWLGTRSLRPAAAAALILLGITTGVSLVSYWVWVRPIWISTIVLPSVGQPARAVAAIGPLVLKPETRRDGSGDTPADRSGGSEPSQPVTTAAAGDLSWTIQAGIFSDPARAASVVARLEELKYPSFQRELDFGGPDRFRVALAGPYGSREAAASALEALRRIPGFEGAVVRPLMP
jgi:type II secretory pathway predicted ATPase ExeA/cell division septation protein DedD